MSMPNAIEGSYTPPYEYPEVEPVAEPVEEPVVEQGIMPVIEPAIEPVLVEPTVPPVLEDVSASLPEPQPLDSSSKREHACFMTFVLVLILSTNF